MENNNNSNDNIYSKPADYARPIYEKPIKPKRSGSLRKMALCFLVIGLLIAGFGFVNGGGGSLTIDRGGLHFHSSNDREERFTLDENSLDAFESIDIDVTSIGIEMVESNRYGLEADSQNQLQWEIKNGKLTVTQDKKYSIYFMDFDFASNESFIKVYYPENADFDSIKLDTSSGGIKGKIINAENVDLNSTSGGIDLAIENCGFVEADCSSGGITLSGNGDAIQADLSSTSGGIEIDGGKWVDMKAESSSGGISINADELLGSSDLECTSGGVDVYLDNGRDYGYDLRASSGDIRVNGDEYDDSVKHNSDAENMLNIRSSSGGIELELK